MKHRSIGGLVLAMAVALGACAPPNQGGQQSAPPSVPESMAPESMAAPATASPEAEESAGASESPDSGSDYDY